MPTFNMHLFPLSVHTGLHLSLCARFHFPPWSRLSDSAQVPSSSAYLQPLSPVNATANVFANLGTDQHDTLTVHHFY